MLVSAFNCTVLIWETIQASCPWTFAFRRPQGSGFYVLRAVSMSACHWCAIVIETADFIEGLPIIDSPSSKPGLIVFLLVTVAWCGFRFELTHSSTS